VMFPFVGITTTESGVVMVEIAPGRPPMGAQIATPWDLETRMKALLVDVLIQIVGTANVLKEVVGSNVLLMKGTTTSPVYERGPGGGTDPELVVMWSF
jgi:hypothetical protein